MAIPQAWWALPLPKISIVLFIELVTLQNVCAYFFYLVFGYFVSVNDIAHFRITSAE